jgi:prepilin-type processing-associated H-X9-DG protein
MVERDKFARPFKINLLVLGLALVVVGLLVAVLWPPLQSRREASPRAICKNNLHQIGLALHNYHDKFGCFPPAYIADERGRPTHSWRVLLLPYIDQAPLYNLYRFDEPWDGPNNSQLARHIIDIYQCPTDAKERDTPQNWTSYVAVIGPHTCWPGSESVSISDIFSDGTSQTLLVVEVHNSGIQWMEPRDLHVTQMAPKINAAGMGISSPHEGGANGLLADGAVRFVSEQTPAETVRRLIERDDGEAVGKF